MCVVLGFVGSTKLHCCLCLSLLILCCSPLLQSTSSSLFIVVAVVVVDVIIIIGILVVPSRGAHHSQGAHKLCIPTTCSYSLQNINESKIVLLWARVESNARTLRLKTLFSCSNGTNDAARKGETKLFHSSDACSMHIAQRSHTKYMAVDFALLIRKIRLFGCSVLVQSPLVFVVPFRHTHTLSTLSARERERERNA